jgi:hypothetical protein
MNLTVSSEILQNFLHDKMTFIPLFSVQPQNVSGSFAAEKIKARNTVRKIVIAEIHFLWDNVVDVPSLEGDTYASFVHFTLTINETAIGRRLLCKGFLHSREKCDD